MPVRIINGLTASLGNPCISGSWGSVNSVWISGYIRDLRCPYVSVFRQQNSQLLCLNVENKHLNSDFFFLHICCQCPAFVKQTAAMKRLQSRSYVQDAPLSWLSCINFLAFWVLEFWRCPVFHCSCPLALVLAQEEGVVSQRVPQVGRSCGGVWAPWACSLHGIDHGLVKGGFERQHGPCCLSAVSSLSYGSLSVQPPDGVQDCTGLYFYNS